MTHTITLAPTLSTQQKDNHCTPAQAPYELPLPHMPPSIDAATPTSSKQFDVKHLYAPLTVTTNQQEALHSTAESPIPRRAPTAEHRNTAESACTLSSPSTSGTPTQLLHQPLHLYAPGPRRSNIDTQPCPTSIDNHTKTASLQSPTAHVYSTLPTELQPRLRTNHPSPLETSQPPPPTTTTRTYSQQRLITMYYQPKNIQELSTKTLPSGNTQINTTRCRHNMLIVQPRMQTATRVDHPTEQNAVPTSVNSHPPLPPEPNSAMDQTVLHNPIPYQKQDSHEELGQLSTGSPPETSTPRSRNDIITIGDLRPTPPPPQVPLWTSPPCIIHQQSPHTDQSLAATSPNRHDYSSQPSTTLSPNNTTQDSPPVDTSATARSTYNFNQFPRYGQRQPTSLQSAAVPHTRQQQSANRSRATTSNTSPPVQPQASKLQRQLTINQFLPRGQHNTTQSRQRKTPNRPTVQPSMKPTNARKQHSNLSYTSSPSITPYLSLPLTTDLHDTWGHSLASIDTSSTFRIILQNPNGLNPYPNNHSLCQDLLTCKDYGAAIISLPETNVNWSLKYPTRHLQTMLRNRWHYARLSLSRANEDFTSQYQPGGTATIVCDKWTSRVIHHGEDPHGLGRWSYVIMRGRGPTKVAIITAYNVSQSYPTGGERTAHQQQARLLTRKIREQNLNIGPHPRRQFILDLQAWIEALQSDNYDIILSLDANEPYNPDHPGTVRHLTYSPATLTHDKMHDGKLSTLIATCGLCDPMAQQHTARPFPPSYFRGRNRIDYILISHRLNEAVERSGSLPFYSVFQSDHRPYYLDLNAKIAFADNAYEIARPQGRGLQLHDPRYVRKYSSILSEQLTYHKVHDKTEDLQRKITDNQWTAEDKERYQRLDIIITEAMLSAERKASCRYSTTYDWSPTLTHAVHTYRFWKMKLKQIKGLTVSTQVINKTHADASLPPDILTATYTEHQIIQAIKAAYHQMRQHQRNHRTLRETYLENLAEAIILHRCPALDTPEATMTRQNFITQQLRQLLARERKRRLYRKLGTTLHPSQHSGLKSIDVPDPRAKGPNIGSPDDPKTWKGPWIALTKPEDIAQRACEMNRKQYNQAECTPFGSGPLATIIGRKADTPTASALLQGTIPTQVLPHLEPETARILRTLSTPAPLLPQDKQFTVTPAEFIATYKRVNEATSSSPSGRHVGHYKAILHDPTLVELHANMMSIPYQVGFAPERWTRVTDIMLEKEPGNPKCHRLRILALLESDFNQSKRIIIARTLSHHTEDNKLVPSMQYGSRPGKLCHSAVLQKVLSHDITRLTRQTAAYMENDAIGCYDRLVNNLVLLTLLRLGVPRPVTNCIGSIWDQAIHHIKTIYGTSTSTYYSTSTTPLYGPGQGSTCGPIFWLLLFCLIVDSIDPQLNTATFTSSNQGWVVNTIGTAFVDDASLSVTSSFQRNSIDTIGTNDSADNAETIQALAALAQHWERLLFSTGGAINMQKSFWYLLSWTWPNGVPTLSTQRKAPGKMELTSGTSRQPEVVPRIEATDSFRTLGIYVSPSGTQTKQFTILRAIADEYYIKITPSKLTTEEAYYSYQTYLRPRLIYPLPCTSLTQQQCRKIQAPALAALLPKLHLNRHTSHHIIFGEHRYGGLALPDLYTDQGVGQLRLLIGHLVQGDEVGRLLLIAISHQQLTLGIGSPFFRLSYSAHAPWIAHNWLTSIWKHTSQLHITVEVENHWIPILPRTGDAFLMELFQRFNFNKKQLGILNRCRLYLQVLTLSDITSAAGNTILPTISQGKRPQHRRSSLTWPRQESPPPQDWHLWRVALNHVSRNNKLQHPLGSWLNRPHQQWEWYIDPTTQMAYRKQTDQTWTAHTPGPSPMPTTRTTRTTRAWYHKQDYKRINIETPTLHPATIYVNMTYPDYFQVDYSTTPIPDTTPPHAHIWDQDPTAHAFVDTPDFYKRLLGTKPLSSNEVEQDIATNLELETLVACSDGSFNPDKAVGGHGWIISTKDKQVIIEGAGPADGNPSSMSSYRTELGGLVAVLYIIFRICTHYHITAGKLIYHCDNKGVLSNVFSSPPVTITSSLQTDFDLVLTAKRLITLIPVTIVAEWVKGHYDGDTRAYKHDLNDRADYLATSFTKQPPTGLHPRRLPITAPNYGARLLYEGSTITTNLRTTMSKALHTTGFTDYLKRKHLWTNQAFNEINWDAHESAFSNLARTKQPMMAKIIHGLLNTNHQNNKYYGKPSTCPCCQSQEETLHHLYSCTQEGATDNREKALLKLQCALATIATPDRVIESIIHGIKQWVHHQENPATVLRAPTRGSINGPDILLTAAYSSQTRDIGWYQLLMGRISRKWGAAVAMYDKTKHSSAQQRAWSTQVIQHIWTYTSSLWEYRNTIVHGATEQDTRDRHRQTIIDKVVDFYDKYQLNSHIVLPRHRYLFTSRTREQRIRLDNDSMTCWLRSVEEAQQEVIRQDARLRQHTDRYFAPFRVHHQPLNDPAPEDTDSSYTAPSRSTNDSTVTTTLATLTLTDYSDTITHYTAYTTSTSASSQTQAGISTSSEPPSIISWSTSSEAESL